MKHVEDLLQSLFVMASMVEAKDPYTGGHLWRVSQYTRLLAEAAELPPSEVARIAVGGFLHDLGKIGIPDHILVKPGRLTDEEFELIRTHPEVGYRLLERHPLAGLVNEAVLSHHETPAGTGYPRKLAGKDIMIEARIVGICDAFDAMTSARPYRQGMHIDKALSIIEKNLEKQFDRELGILFLQLGKQGLLDNIMGHSEPGIPMQTCPICGPIIVVSRKHHTGDHVYCRSCGSEAVIEKPDGDIHLKATGQKGRAKDLEPNIDLDLIEELTKSASEHLIAPI